MDRNLRHNRVLLRGSISCKNQAKLVNVPGAPGDELWDICAMYGIFFNQGAARDVVA